MKSILVTGAGGFIGRRLISFLENAGHSVRALGSEDGDIADPATLGRLDALPVDFVFHLAGRTYVPDAWREPADFQRVNVVGTLNVLELCRAKKIPLTYVSAYLYGIPSSLPVKETDRIEPNNPYALSKTLAESLCRFYAEHFAIPLTIIRPFNIYGPGQKGHFLIPEIMAQIKAGKPIRLKDLFPRRDYLYLDDLVDALIRTIGPKPGFHVYNIGYGSSFSVREIVDVIQSVAGTSLPVVSENAPRQNEISDVYADIGKAVRELNWHPRHSLEEGIKTMIFSGEHIA
ncbi:MAG: NAD(P)-dependent oxidoreductase [Nitrospinae bacterium]|nr:NAD(P)-dependent oxidoreductase [Nitrospinota bacterium]